MRRRDARTHPADARPRRSLGSKYFAALLMAVLVPLLASGISQAWFSYQDHRKLIDVLLRAEAASAAESIQGFLDGIVRQLGWTTHLPVDAGNVGTIEQWGLDADRLLRQVPAITELALVARSGAELMKVSRHLPDTFASGADHSVEPAFTQAVERGVYYGPVYFRQDSEPYMRLALAGAHRSAGVSIAEVNLKLVWDVVSQIQIGEAGVAYVVDDRGRLIAHPDISRVLRGSAASAARASTLLAPVPGASSASIESEDANEQGLILAMAPVSDTQWTVVVEQPLAEAFAPIHAAFLRTGILLLAGTALAGAVAYFLARRMSEPIRRLEEGAGHIGSGRFDHRIQISTGDELEQLASRFNAMASELALSQERSLRITRLKQFLAPQIADLIEREGQDELLDSRRVDVVVVFCDLRNFTSFSAKVGPDEVMNVLRQYFGALGPVITKFEATQTSFTGDGLMMLLNAPVPCRNPVERAAAMAMEMQAAVQSLIAGWRTSGYAVGFGMGLAKGPATVGRIGYENRLDYTAIGNVVNLAARLCSSAADGQILIDAATAEELGAFAPRKALGELQLKGFDTPVHVHSVLWGGEEVAVGAAAAHELPGSG